MFHEGSKDCLDFLSDIALALVGSMYQEVYSYTQVFQFCRVQNFKEYRYSLNFLDVC